jgi:hypothetical protein
MSEGIKNDTAEDAGRKFEMLCGVVLAIFAAILAITDLGGGKFGDDELIAANEKASAYSWYQSKSVKQILLEGQQGLLQALVDSDSINPEQAPAIESTMASLQSEIERYKKEKNEILLGSDCVGQENWVQDINGEMGKVIGAQEWEELGIGLGESGDMFDYSTLFLQICLVLGAISLIFSRPGPRWTFFWGMNILGIIGTVIAIYAFKLAFAAS